MKSILTAVTIAASLTAIPGAAAEGECSAARGAITGTLTSNGAPAEVEVRAWREASDFPLSDTTRSDPATGKYTLRVLPATYKIEFTDTGPSDPDATSLGVLGEWYDNKQSPDLAKRITIAAAGDVGVADADLEAAAAIRVHVVDDATGAPLEGFTTRVYPEYEVFRAYKGGPPTNEHGVFRIGGLRTTNLRVLAYSRAQTGYGYEWFDEGATRAEATPVAVVAGSQTDITFRLDSGAGRIVGRVTDEVSGEPLDEVGIRLRGLGFLDARTGTNGRYQLNGLRHGDYKLKFDGLTRCSPAITFEACDYEIMWFGGSPGPDQAAPITVASADPIVIDAELDVIRCRGVPATTVGSRGDDVLSGTVIAGLGGDDTILAGADSLVCAGAGNDTVDGSTGADTIYGGAGDDRLRGKTGKDHIYGGSGNDLVSGDFGNDVLSGGPGNDRAVGGRGHDVMQGGDGDDQLLPNQGKDTMIGGTGQDTAYFLGPAHPVMVDLAAGTAFHNGHGKTLDSIEIVRATPQDDLLIGSDLDEEFIARGGDDVVDGGGGDDKIDAGKGNDIVDGGDGSDVIWGRGGDDELSGGAGADVVRGGQDDDSLSGGPGSGDVCWGGAGTDSADATCEVVHGLLIM